MLIGSLVACLLAGDTRSYVPAVEFEVMQFSDNGTLSSITLTAITTPTVGCNETDWTTGADQVVLVPPGVCSYYAKASAMMVGCPMVVVR